MFNPKVVIHPSRVFFRCPCQSIMSISSEAFVETNKLHPPPSSSPQRPWPSPRAQSKLGAKALGLGAGGQERAKSSLKNARLFKNVNVCLPKALFHVSVLVFFSLKHLFALPVSFFVVKSPSFQKSFRVMKRLGCLGKHVRIDSK
jgi:hypothetical protein